MRKGWEEAVKRLKKSIDKEDGTSVASDLRIFNSFGKPTEKRFVKDLENNDWGYVASSCNQCFGHGSLWTEIAMAFLQTLMAVQNEDFEGSFQLHLTLCSSLNRLVSNESRWILPIIYHANNDLVRFAEKTVDKVKNLEEAARSLNRTFTLCINDRADIKVSRKWGTYQSINSLFKVYFILKQQNLCAPIIRAVNNTDLPALEEFPKSHSVTFRFYTGLLAFLDENYSSAQEHFVFALKHCHKTALANKRRILHYLIPVNLMFRERPKLELLERYGLLELYGPLLESLCRGQLHRYQEIFLKHEKLFLKKGTFLTWEKVTFLVYRQLFFRTYRLLDFNPRLSIETFRIGLNVAECSVSVEEVQCLIANMIDKGLIKGYLSFEKQFLVLSQKDPFPQLEKI